MSHPSKKVLILSYFFPPCTLTASSRAYSWSKYFHKFGVYPVVVTRKWDKAGVKTQKDLGEAVLGEVEVEKGDGFEIHRLPYKPGLRDRIYAKHGDDKKVLLRRMLTVFNLLFQHFSFLFLDYRNLYYYSKKLLQNDVAIQTVITTAQPFNLFKMGYHLKKHFPTVKWIADYRDAWTTSSPDGVARDPLYKMIAKINSHFEGKWMQKADVITSVSLPLAEQMGTAWSRPFVEIQNGYLPEDFASVGFPKKFEKFTIAYLGTVYAGQRIEVFLDAFKQLIDTGKKNVQLLFIGIGFDVEQNNRVQELLKGYEEYYELKPRIPKAEVLEIERKSHQLLHFGWPEIKGIIGSKTYEYLGAGAPMLVVPADEGCIDEILEATGFGKSYSTTEQTLKHLEEMYALFESGNWKDNDPNAESIQFYTREHQSKLMAELV